MIAQTSRMSSSAVATRKHLSPCARTCVYVCTRHINMQLHQLTCCVLARAHVDCRGFLSVRKEIDMFMQILNERMLRSHAVMDLTACARRHFQAKGLLRSHAGSTLAPFCVRKETCSCRKHTGISLRAHVNSCDNRVVTPRAHRVRKETCSCEKTAASYVSALGS